MLFCTALYAGDFTVKSLEEAQTISESTNQPILLIFGSPDCLFCEQLNNAITTEEFKQDIDKFIICYIDLTIENNKVYKTEYKISIIPDSYIMQDGKVINHMSGYEKNKYLKWLKTK